MKLALCLPCRDQVQTGFAYDLARLAAYFGMNEGPSGGALHIFTSKRTLIASQRESLAEQALEAGCDYIMWLDTDMRFPKDIYKRLASHGKDIVAANYATRRIPVKTVAFDALHGEWSCVYTRPEDTGLREVAAVGMGAMLVKTSVYTKIPKPWHLIGYSAKVNDYSGEDVFFCKAAAHAGFKIYIDQDVSKEIAHIGEFEYRHEHSEACIGDPDADNKLKQGA